ncbi:MAG: hypothetical protein KBD76_10810 [Bacteriovorax sp.]|jgi:hypothetical protein|nr:hypothetical protein [Bacteriovorax sp.]
MQKKAHSQTQSPSLPFIKGEEESILLLEARIKKLDEICTELNPYIPVSLEFQKRLREFNIMEYEDPFKITNALLRLLEDSVDELHRLRPLSAEEKLKESYR